ncbi:DUF4440 domain-containing protein [Formosa sp. 3Alg 14/1]|uniref:DUF4440 domain-containing protein n=1 Tax=Formosa sp. 3Alg 14/1 TaxID=3382190 RepID=UPI0039BE0532
MKKIIILLSLCFAYACETTVKPEPTKNIELTESQKQADIDSVKSLVSDSFQDIFSDFDSTIVSKYYTTDFVLLENGVLWTNDSIYSYIRRKQANKSAVKRLNRFEYVKSEHSENMIWVAYDNYAYFVKEKDTIGKAHWLESAIAKKENNTWKIQQLHSTVVRKNKH